MHTQKPPFVTARDLLITLGISALYLLLSYWLIGYKQDQLTLVLLFNAAYYLSSITRKFITGFAIFMLFWIIFDFMKAFPNYRYNEVHIESLYLAEKKWFGIQSASGILTPNEYWQANHTTLLDILTGFFYLSWVPVPLGFAAFLFFRKRSWFLQFSLTFLLVNLIGFAIYYIYPAAPPWYVQQHGFVFEAGTPGNTAGLERFDQYFQVNIFSGLYAKSSNVFAAMPSLHSAYPLIVLYHGLRYKLGWVNVFFAVIMGGIWFAAVYTSHHYLLDVLFGILCAIVGISLYAWITKRSVLVKNWVNAYEKRIS
ncbi:MAG: inositol phosphorylceramide synthase [Chitinophagaceae bacterium]|jgi:hypothetical protein|nr:inositol phosphorylceramide synthase [Chitinophagaceae bacterium]